MMQQPSKVLVEIENKSSSKYEEVASETVGKEEALTSAMAEIIKSSFNHKY